MDYFEENPIVVAMIFEKSQAAQCVVLAEPLTDKERCTPNINDGKQRIEAEAKRLVLTIKNNMIVHNIKVK